MLKVGQTEKNKQGRLLILGGHLADLYRAGEAYEIDSEPVIRCRNTVEAIEAYNLFNGTVLQTDYIEKWFEPWYKKTYPDAGKDYYIPVPSNTVEGKEYKVWVRTDGRIECSCAGFNFRKTCRHVEMTREFLKAKRI